jgi:hypothetical protein
MRTAKQTSQLEFCRRNTALFTGQNSNTLSYICLVKKLSRASSFCISNLRTAVVLTLCCGLYLQEWQLRDRCTRILNMKCDYLKNTYNRSVRAYEEPLAFITHEIKIILTRPGLLVLRLYTLKILLQIHLFSSLNRPVNELNLK